MSLHFDGATGAATKTTDLGIGAYPFTVALWVKATAPSGVDTLVNFQDKDVTNVMYGVDIDSNGLASIRAQNTTAEKAIGTTNIADRWSFVSAAFAGNTTKRLYVDGKASEANLTTSVTFNTATDSWDVGRRGDSTPTNLLTGTAAFVQVWNRRLFEEEFRQAMMYPGSVQNGLVLFWPFFVESPTIDFSRAKNDATSLTGTTAVAEGPPINGMYVIPSPVGSMAC